MAGRMRKLGAPKRIRKMRGVSTYTPSGSSSDMRFTKPKVSTMPVGDLKSGVIKDVRSTDPGAGGFAGPTPKIGNGKVSDIRVKKPAAGGFADVKPGSLTKMTPKKGPAPRAMERASANASFKRAAPKPAAKPAVAKSVSSVAKPRNLKKTATPPKGWKPGAR